MACSSRSEVAGNVAWPASVTIAKVTPPCTTRQEAPKPVPGPTTSIGAPVVEHCLPSENRSEEPNAGSDHAKLSKSLRRCTDLKPNALRKLPASTVHGLFVRVPRSFSIGPATPKMPAPTEPAAACGARKAAIASVAVGYSDTFACSIGPITPRSSSAKRALVPPMSASKVRSISVTAGWPYEAVDQQAFIADTR